TPSPAAAQAGETVAGRITHVDTKAGTLTVKASNSEKVLKLKAADSINLHKLRRGERVAVTYSGGIATRGDASRPGKKGALPWLGAGGPWGVFRGRGGAFAGVRGGVGSQAPPVGLRRVSC